MILYELYKFFPTSIQKKVFTGTKIRNSARISIPPQNNFPIISQNCVTYISSVHRKNLKKDDIVMCLSGPIKIWFIDSNKNACGYAGYKCLYKEKILFIELKDIKYFYHIKTS